MVKTQNMPAYKFDIKCKFKISEVDEWMHSQNCITNEESEADENA